MNRSIVDLPVSLFAYLIDLFHFYALQGVYLFQCSILLVSE